MELGRDTVDDMVSVRSEGATTVEAMDMVRDCGGMLPWLVFLALAGGMLFTGD